MLIGLILYISIFKAEVGSKLRPKSTLQPAVFSYRYGYSFILYIVGILLVFCSGILNVFLYTGFHNETTFGRSVKVNFLNVDFRSIYQKNNLKRFVPGIYST